MKFLRRWGLIMVVLTVMVGCQRDADKLQRVATLAAEKVRAAAGGAHEPVASGFQMMKTTIDELSPEARVTARLRWDKALMGSTVKVKAVGGVVELKGGVANGVLKERAVHLAQTTMGVEKVVDALEITGGEP
jgi:osmotically-inducible protein OsmY